MTVSVGRNGEVKGVVLQRSSGRKILDDAALNVVKLASPFEPLPKTSEDIDILELATAQVGKPLWLAVDPARFHFFDPATGLRLERAAAPALARA